ncbi:hypothetical protein [uncultured Sphingomonas sp.]|uniref:hypothetical protein n=1 Tax=uncultured Sphingomonas sp. TaxID=158754 RepID=UPI0025F33957|nr:hypothetical protein [uncultured Sphingomonas sp.]
MPIRARTYRPSIWARTFLAENWKVVLHPSRGDRLALATDDIACVDVNAVDVTKALIWHTVEIRSPDRIEKLTGLSAAAAQTLRHDLVHFINQHLAALISRSEGQLRGVDAAVRLITDAKRQYLAHAFGRIWRLDARWRVHRLVGRRVRIVGAHTDCLPTRTRSRPRHRLKHVRPKLGITIDDSGGGTGNRC